MQTDFSLTMSSAVFSYLLQKTAQCATCDTCNFLRKFSSPISLFIREIARSAIIYEDALSRRARTERA